MVIKNDYQSNRKVSENENFRLAPNRPESLLMESPPLGLVHVVASPVALGPPRLSEFVHPFEFAAPVSQFAGVAGVDGLAVAVHAGMLASGGLME